MVQIQFISKSYTQVYEKWITSPIAGGLVTGHDF